MTNYRVTIGWADSPATVEEHLERVSEAAMDVAPQTGPAAGANLITGTIELTMEIAADTDQPDVGVGVVRESLRVLQRILDASRVYGEDEEIHVERIEAVKVRATEHELVPA